MRRVFQTTILCPTDKVSLPILFLKIKYTSSLVLRTGILYYMVRTSTIQIRISALNLFRFANSTAKITAPAPLAEKRRAIVRHKLLF